MLTISTTTEEKASAAAIVASIPKLNELVKVVTHDEVCENEKHLVLENNHIGVPLEWHDGAPPYIFQKRVFSEGNLLALIFYQLGNHQKAFDFIAGDTPLYYDLLVCTHLKYGYPIDARMLYYLEKGNPHNQAIVGYYGTLENASDIQNPDTAFKKAITFANNPEEKAFTAKHFINYLLDHGKSAEALRYAKASAPLSETGKYALKTLEAHILMLGLKMPYDPSELKEIRQLQTDILGYYESNGFQTQAGLLLMEAAEVANYAKDFIVSKDLIHKAIRIFKEEGLSEFLGEAGFKKAILLYTWSKNGHPQYYKAAINAFQDALKVFKKDSHPKRFADIHHNLALIYSEIPVAPEEKPMWMAFCAASFKEVLQYYTAESAPYDYAMACHNYATALMDFPPGKLHDHQEKARTLFKEALKIRTAEHYPLERALTLSNFLELSWLLHNEDAETEKNSLTDMMAMSHEIPTLTEDSALRDRAKTHLLELEKLKQLL